MKNRAAKSGQGAETPLMRQYARIKGQFPDAILLFRIGDFYETFDEDARTASRVLGITLTKRNNGAAASQDLAGFPHHSLENYLPRLVRAGHRVAVCDQLEDPKLAKTVVERGVTEVVTPGVAFNDRVTDPRGHNWLAAICAGKGRYGLAFLDVTTGEFHAGEGDAAATEKYLDSHAPAELLHARGEKDPLVSEATHHWNAFALEEWAFTADFARERLLNTFGTSNLKGFGIEDLHLAQRAAGAILHYLGETRHDRLGHITRINRLEEGTHLALDRFTVRNLELVTPLHEGARTLLACMDRTRTPMGARLLKRWLLFPLLDRAAIGVRHDRVQALVDDPALREKLRTTLAHIGDLERLAGKAATARIHPRELLHLGRSIEAAERTRQDLLTADERLARMAGDWAPPQKLARAISDHIEPEAPVNIAKGGVLKPGVDSELDDLRHVTSHAKDLLMGIQQREADRTGITSLKVGYNNVFGYYLEVRHTHREKVPADWTRKQTLTGAERYITAELKELEERILSAEERIGSVEQRLFTGLVEQVHAATPDLQATAAALAALDVLTSFAENAVLWRYARPELTNDPRLEVREGRHPVIEQQLPPGEPYVTNDLLLDPQDRQLVVITGPNMSGKSALLRQTALHVLMAQCGSFIPARSAVIGITDRVFTRVGASDDLSTGESTFMVEMNETASILHNLTDRSLVLLDEIGRGTSTYDGISIAWAIAEYLHEHPGRPKTLFATHYHELNEMAGSFPRIHNANVSVREVQGKVLFLRKLVSGGTDRSFGIHVARMAGMPAPVIDRAQKVLHHLELSHAGDLGEADGTPLSDRPADSGPRKVARADTTALDREPQLSIFQLDDPALEGIRAQLERIDIDTLTPVEALLKLNEIKRMAGVRPAKLKKA
ncbi:MAG TPA: DNA mismatch repair protein MutS [Flavobacteriales bacterium]|nr:DNA mismatch repair protein MutS [Flavobacteriales bacterium]